MLQEQFTLTSASHMGHAMAVVHENCQEKPVVMVSHPKRFKLKLKQLPAS